MKSGQRLMLLLKTRLPEILSKESANQSSIYLYNIGDYWVAFEKSAHLLSQRYPQCSLCPLGFKGNTSHVVMASVPYVDIKDTIMKPVSNYEKRNDSVVVLS